MTALQVQNFQNPIQYLATYDNAVIGNYEQLQNILMPENPIKQKFFNVWHFIKNKILDDAELCYLYGKLNIDKCFDEISLWTIAKIKNYVGLYLWKYGKNISFYGFDFRIKDEDAKIQHKIIFVICQNFLERYYPNYEYYDLADWHMKSGVVCDYKREDIVEIEVFA